MRISDWSSDVCSSDLHVAAIDDRGGARYQDHLRAVPQRRLDRLGDGVGGMVATNLMADLAAHRMQPAARDLQRGVQNALLGARRSEEHTSELQSLMRISYAVFCLKKKKSEITRL